MPATTHPNLPIQYNWDLGEAYKTGMDENLAMLGALTQLSVINRTTSTPPASPTNGDRYIVPAAATGVWAGKTNQIAVRIDGMWEFHPPKVGWLCYIEDEAKLSAYKSSGWSAGIAI